MLCKIINELFFNRNRIIYAEDINYKKAQEILEYDKASLLIDVRSPQEYREKHLNNSINIPLYEIYKNSKNLKKIGSGPIILYCQTGNRSKKAAERLYKLGYRNLYNILDGLDNI